MQQSTSFLLYTLYAFLSLSKGVERCAKLTKINEAGNSQQNQHKEVKKCLSIAKK